MNLLGQEEARVLRIKQGTASAGAGQVGTANGATSENRGSSSYINQRIDRMEQKLDDLFTQAKALEAALKEVAVEETTRNSVTSEQK